jgi:hypothetical protein
MPGNARTAGREYRHFRPLVQWLERLLDMQVVRCSIHLWPTKLCGSPSCSPVIQGGRTLGFRSLVC